MSRAPRIVVCLSQIFHRRDRRERRARADKPISGAGSEKTRADSEDPVFLSATGGPEVSDLSLRPPRALR